MWARDFAYTLPTILLLDVVFSFNDYYFGTCLALTNVFTIISQKIYLIYKYKINLKGKKNTNKVKGLEISRQRETDKKTDKVENLKACINYPHTPTPQTSFIAVLPREKQNDKSC